MNFVAVILGVLLGFYINEQAKFSDEKKERVLLINSMINDLTADIKTYEDYQIPVNVKYKKGIDSLLYYLYANEPQKINATLPLVFQVENYTPNSSVYNSIKSSGKIRLIEDLNVQKQLSDFYDGLVLECVKKNEVQVSYFLDDVVKWLTLNADLMEMKLQDKSNTVVLRNTLMIYQSFVDQKIDNYQLIVKESGMLKEELEGLLQF